MPGYTLSGSRPIKLRVGQLVVPDHLGGEGQSRDSKSSVPNSRPGFCCSWLPILLVLTCVLENVGRRWTQAGDAAKEILV